MKHRRIGAREFSQWRQELRRARRILLSLHRHPDGDSIAANLALARILRRWGKQVAVASVDPLPEQFSFLPGFAHVRRTASFASAFQHSIDTFIALDTSVLSRVLPENFSPPPAWRIHNIDHHITNTHFGHFNLVDPAAAATCEILAEAVRAWRVPLDSSLATLLLTGILTDSAGLLNTAASPQTYLTAAHLMQRGGRLHTIVLHVFRTVPLPFLGFWGEVLKRVKVMRRKKWCFAGASIPYRVWRSCGLPQASFAHEMAVNMFLAVVEGTDFGYLLTEVEPRTVRGSLRARTRVDVARIARVLGGGGLAAAAGLTVKGKTLPAVERELRRAIADAG